MMHLASGCAPLHSRRGRTRPGQQWVLTLPPYFGLVGGDGSDEGLAHFGKVVSKVPAHRMTDVVERLGRYRDQRPNGEELGASFPDGSAAAGVPVSEPRWEPRD